MVSDEIVNRIRKVLAYTGSPNENEAAVAVAKAQEMLARHNLTMADIGEDKDLGITNQQFWLVNKANQGKWRQLLLTPVCQYHFTKIMVSSQSYRQGKNESLRAYIIGEPTNVEVTLTVYHWLIEQIEAAYPYAWRAYSGYEAKGKFRRGFFEGAVVSVTTSLYAKWKTLQDEALAQTTALVKVHGEAIEAYVDQTFTRSDKDSKGHRIGSASFAGYWAGREAGDEIDVSGGE